MVGKKIIVLAMLAWLAIVLATYGSAEPQCRLVSEVYTVRAGDTLDEISYKYMAKSPVTRDIREFREGVIELNWDRIFKDRYPHGIIYPGDMLQINYWLKE